MGRVGWVIGSCAALCVLLLAAGRTGFRRWESAHLGQPFVTSAVGFILLPLLVLMASRTPLRRAGLSMTQPARWLEVACSSLAVLGPLGGTAFGLLSLRGLDPRHWPGALVLTAAYAACVPLLVWFLSRTRTVDAEPHRTTVGWLLGLVVAVTAVAALAWPHGRLGVEVAYTLVLVGIGEELFFRGLLQSLLDDVFGAPWRLGGVALGWGWVVQAVLFGVIHPVVAGDMSLAGWALWTGVFGLAMGWVRAKAGTIAAPALVHGVLDTIGLVVVPALMA